MIKMYFRKQTVVSLALVACVTAMSTCLPVSAGETVDELAMERALRAHVRPLMDSLRERNVKVVGVLKFVVQREGRDLSSSEGRLNMRLAEKTEIALTFANPPAAQAIARQVGVVKNATDIAATIPEATHLFIDDQAKREKLFSKKYKLAWQIDGQSEAVPDAFVFGVGKISDDLQHIAIQLSAFVKGQEKLIHGDEFETLLDPDDLACMGENFLVGREATNRTPVSAGKYEGEAHESAVKSITNPEEHVLQNGPVQLEVYYDGQKQPLRFLDNQSKNAPGAVLKEPLAGQKVSFIASRRDINDKSRYGILLRVNGENTLYRERLPDDRCHIWVLEAESKSIPVTGYQKTKGADGEEEPFLVVEGKKAIDAVDFYGHDAGLITLTVYGERVSDQSEHVPADDLVLRTMQDSVLPAAIAQNLSHLNGNLTRSILGKSKTRGMLVPDPQAQKRSIRDVEFKREDRPFFSASVRYYTP